MDETFEADVFHTDFLMSDSDAWIGAGSIFNIAGNYYSYDFSESATEADSNAIRSDWGIVFQDFKKAIIDILSENGPEKRS